MWNTVDKKWKTWPTLVYDASAHEEALVMAMLENKKCDSMHMCADVEVLELADVNSMPGEKFSARHVYLLTKAFHFSKTWLLLSPFRRMIAERKHIRPKAQQLVSNIYCDSKMSSPFQQTCCLLRAIMQHLPPLMLCRFWIAEFI